MSLMTFAIPPSEGYFVDCISMCIRLFQSEVAPKSGHFYVHALLPECGMVVSV